MTTSQDSIIRTRKSSIEDLLKLADQGYLYVVMDSCSVPSVPLKAVELGVDRAVSLYRESAEEEFWDVAPYLLKLDHQLLDWLSSMASHGSWGIFVVSKADVQTLRWHLRHFLRVKEPEGDFWLFRFYDPRVLTPFLPSCSKNELREFYGPILAYGTGDEQLKNIVFYFESDGRTPSEQQSPPPYRFVFELRDQHVAALEQQWKLAFAEEVMDFLRTKHNALVADFSVDELRRRVLLGLNRAEQYGFERQASLAAFVALMFRIGPNFDNQTGIRAVLTDRDVHPDFRMDRFASRTTEQDWDEALSQADQSIWNS